MIVRFEPLTASHILAYYGEEQAYPIRGYAVLQDDKVAGVFGIYQDQGLDIVFCNVREDLWAKRNTRWGRRVMISGMRLVARMKNEEDPLYVYADDDAPNAEEWLEHFGFERLKGRAYIWH